MHNTCGKKFNLDIHRHMRPLQDFTSVKLKVFKSCNYTKTRAKAFALLRSPNPSSGYHWTTKPYSVVVGLRSMEVCAHVTDDICLIFRIFVIRIHDLLEQTEPYIWICRNWCSNSGGCEHIYLMVYNVLQFIESLCLLPVDFQQSTQCYVPKNRALNTQKFPR
jgi:hypothetical protein